MKTYNMTRRTKYLLGVIATGFLLSIHPVTAAQSPTVKGLQNVKIEGHFFTTSISGTQERIYTKEPSKFRYLVLVLSATLEKGEGRIFAHDFTLRYFHKDEREDRGGCRGMAMSKETAPERIFDLGIYALGEYSQIKLHSGQNRFALSFFIGSDVEIIDLYLLGMAEPLTYRIGTDRLYSVFITTNTDTKTLLQAKEIIQKGNYKIIDASENLTKEETGITIHYCEQAENQAREISQRLMIELGKATVLKKMELITDVDVVVWLGK